MKTNPEQKCIELAKKSTFRCRHGAVIVYNGHILSTGMNLNLFHSVTHSYNQLQTLHAEPMAILRVKNKRLLKNSSIYVCRINKHNELMLSKPCKTCMKIIKSFGISEINYSIYGGWTTMNIDQEC